LKGREMKQVLIRLEMPDSYTDDDVAKRVARLCDRKILRDFIECGDDEIKRNSFSSVIRAASRIFDIDVDDIKSNKRTGNLITPRHMVCYICSEELKMSLTKIGRLMGRDHTSILHGVRTIKEKMRRDPSLWSKCEAIIVLSQEIEDERIRIITAENEKAKRLAEEDQGDRSEPVARIEQARLPSLSSILARKVPVIRKTSAGNIISAE